MLDRGTFPATRLVAQAAPPLPVDRFVVGKSKREITALLPRLFNLCRGAQTVALEAALGQHPNTEAITREVLRDHLLKLYVTWPGFFGGCPIALPENWETGGIALIRAVFNAPSAPQSGEAFTSFLAGDTAAARSLRLIADSFAPGEAATEHLPGPTLATIWDAGPVENSVAMRQCDHPVMQRIEVEYGRGPFWRAAARLFDLEAAALGRLPQVITGPGSAMVPAARGAYAIYVETHNDHVTEFHRVTPTDALLAPGGVLERSLSRLPGDKTGFGPLLLDILDPCCPVRLREVTEEVVHA